ncbi:carbohydrate esterase family 16 protein [Zopfia rhizophila CBS 207.26]|uniref:Carbohydrate esterase family 16 protein n=1 Tax=Zopfia rhizophila CBS 207.26 TaxID=1314779 RepID=A0A6A6EBI5_9PEZI|nr:carbohydrate esterase family 16 protein [Zopfia rhizophila CBS 207.26]
MIFLSHLHFLYLFLLSLTSSASAFPWSEHPTKPFSWKTTESLIAFGDSYTYVLGTLGRTNYSFIGDLQKLAFTPEQLLSNSIVQNQTGTAEGGPNWVEYLTGCGVTPGLTKPMECEIQLWDFAFAGADISEEFTPLHHNYTVMLDKQIEQFINYGDPVLSTFLDKSKALVTSWIGINDVSDSAKYNVSFPDFYNKLQTRHFELMEKVYRLGYKNFLFMNLPPLHRRPNLVFSPNSSVNTTMVQWFNTALSNQANAFEKAHSDATVMVFDVNKVLNSVLDEPEKWGFKNATGYCKAYNQPDILTNPEKYECLPQSEYVWFDSGHLTWKTHEVFTRFLRDFLGGKSR